MQVIDIVGQRFGALTVTGRADPGARKEARWTVLCDCGTVKSVRSSHLRYGLVLTCGSSCQYSPSKISQYKVTHGKTETVEYSTWKRIIGRCYNPNTRKYHCWGGRGIEVCERWRNSFPAFAEDMGLRPTSKHSIDRIDNDGNYEPGNCRWATNVQQSQNKRSNRFVIIRGISATSSQWADWAGIERSTLNWRLNHGWAPEVAISAPREVNRKTPPVANEDIVTDVLKKAKKCEH